MSNLDLTAILTAEQAAYIRATCAPVAKVQFLDGAAEGFQVIRLRDAAALEYLEALPSDADGHVDTEGRLWIGGASYQLDIVHHGGLVFEVDGVRPA